MAMRSEMIGKPLEGFAEYVRAAAAEGAVLLKNEGGVLPLKKGERIAVFGTHVDFDAAAVVGFFKAVTGTAVLWVLGSVSF